MVPENTAPVVALVLARSIMSCTPNLASAPVNTEAVPSTKTSAPLPNATAVLPLIVP